MNRRCSHRWAWGGAVVAEELRALAERTSELTDNIVSDIGNVLQQSNDIVKSQKEIVSTVSTQQAIATNEISEYIAQVVIGAHANSEIALQSESVANHLRKLTWAS